MSPKLFSSSAYVLKYWYINVLCWTNFEQTFAYLGGIVWIFFIPYCLGISNVHRITWLSLNQQLGLWPYWHVY